jgi:hypothetical protein
MAIRMDDKCVSCGASVCTWFDFSSFADFPPVGSQYWYMMLACSPDYSDDCRQDESKF